MPWVILMGEREVEARKQAEMLQDVLSHDMNNFLQIILMNAEVLNAETTDDLTKGRSRTIIDCCGEASKLVKNAMQISKLNREGHSVTLSPVKIAAVIEGAYNTVKRLTPLRNITCTKEVHGDGVAMANNLLSQVFINLFSNSIKYSRENDVILSVAVNDIVKDGRPYAEITVMDNGIGLPQDWSEKFVRYRTSAHGNGLGLSMVNEIVTGSYNGALEVHDRRDGKNGVAVTVTLRKS
ncbi:MAG: sensor histidine kinase [Rhabdochlamydiaceae bacterium]